MRRFAWLGVVTLLVACGGDEDGEKKVSTGGTGGAAGSVASGGSTPTGGTSGDGGTTATGGQAGSPPIDAGSGDFDGDGIDDAKELELAQSYFPYYSLDPDDKCPLHGVLFRLTPHPADPSKLAIWYIVLFQNDCGANGHVGDDEGLGVIADPAQPAPAGILAVRAISHQGTPCERTTTCGSLPNCDACKTASKNGQMFPLAYPSVNKHGNYVDEGSCDTNFICDFGGCALNPTPDAPMFANAGEPGKPLTNDLTTNGFITQSNGWTAPELMNFDPWGNTDFGGAGNVTNDLQDQAFVIAPTGC